MRSTLQVAGVLAVMFGSTALVFWIGRTAETRDAGIGATTSAAGHNATPAPDAGELEHLRRLAQAEALLRLGNPQGALQLTASISADGAHAYEARRLRAWAHHDMGNEVALYDLLRATDDSQEESRLLLGIAKRRMGFTASAATDLRELWLTHPDSVWGLAALRELAGLPRAAAAYGAEEVAVIEAHAPAPRSELRFRAGEMEALALGALAEGAPRGTRLAIEAQYALGQQLLRAGETSAAIATLSRVLAAAPSDALQRAVALRLGQALRRKGSYERAMPHLERAALGEDRLAAEALAEAGQAAVEFRRYDKARRLFQEQLVRNPLGPSRQPALWGLGWVALRTGDFAGADHFFAALRAEAPHGALAPAALYWRARALEEQGRRDDARRVLGELVECFPVDYYAYRAWEMSPALPAAQPCREAPVTSLAQIDRLIQGGLEGRASALLHEVADQVSTLPPAALRALVASAQRLGLKAIADRANAARMHRFPTTEDVPSLILDFPQTYTRMIEHEARRQRIDADLVVAHVRHASAFQPRWVAASGGLGLMQLLPLQARALLYEDERVKLTYMGPDVHARVIEQSLDPAINLRLGMTYLGRVLRAFSGHAEYALAAYSAGPGAVTRWRSAHGELPADIFVEEIPYPHTREYVKRVLGTLQLYRFLRQEPPRLAQTAAGR